MNVSTAMKYDFCGQPVSAAELAFVITVSSDCRRLSRTELANTICENLNWRRPTGRLKTIECRAFLEELAAVHVLDIPPARPGRPRGSRTSVSSPHVETPSISGTVGEFAPVELVPVFTKEDNALWRSLVESHHYLGHRVPFGAHLRYLIRVHHPEPVVVGCLQFSSPAWRMAARDLYLGWDASARKLNLQRVVSNSRFLLLPTVRIKNLASKVLSLAANRIADDWEHRFALRPLLLETLVDTERYPGTCYRAANWIEAGVTTGRGRNDREHQRHGCSPKKLFLFPLVKDAAQRLREGTR
jgi:Domain of unknown function (DUF4338)